MVERPIKKSERQSQDAADTSPSKPSDFQPPVKPTPKAVGRGDERLERNNKGNKGKKAYGADESKQAINPALVRGPKPVKAPVPVSPPETESELVSEEPQEEATTEESVDNAVD
jgi:hypothetical protein